MGGVVHAALLGVSRAIIGVFVLADRNLLLLVMGIVTSLTVAVMVWWSRDRRWQDIVLMSVAVFVGWALLAHLIFAYGIGVPITRFSMISMTGDY